MGMRQVLGLSLVLLMAGSALAAAVRNGADVKPSFDRLGVIVERVYELAI
jgi:hypothetical protein